MGCWEDLMNQNPRIDKFLEAQQRMEKAIDESFLRLEYKQDIWLSYILDARFKDRLSEDRTRFRSTSDELDRARSRGSHYSVEPPEKMSRPSFFDSLGIYDASVTKRPSTQLQLEINAYVLENVNSLMSIVWNLEEHCKIFPSLQCGGSPFLSSPSTSVASEQLFSVARDVFHYRRFKLAPNNAEMLVFLNKVLPLLHYQY
uniref:HAT C-terminal dimerisation domain-containing protein n=1 Tax=Ditylenchus dipsaci TaxID=166011 RepID=A0A915EEP0_9BILA